MQERVVALIAGEASPALADQVAVLLRQVKAGARLGGQLGLAALVASLIRIFYHMQKAFDLIWEAPVPESSEGLEVQASRFLRAEIRHFLVWIVIGLLLQLVFTFALVTSVVQAVPAILTVHLGALAVGPSVAITTLVFALVYKTQPRVPVAWRDTWLGAAMAAAAWEVGRQVLALGIGNSHYSAYGAVGSFLIVMVWLYFANSVLYLGAMFVRATAAEHAAEP
jgi:membrane protein